ncbi:MAG: hypothetical protein IPM34_09775 [Saprospiraceae bacterium]|nr:hypothetical protein [Saprospiraceae bacterium]
MISVQNHRQQSNGNRPVILWLCILFLINWACGSSRKVISADKQFPEPKPEKEIRKEAPVVKVDTIVWKEVKPEVAKESQNEPVIGEKNKEQPSESITDIPESPLHMSGLKKLNILFLAPFTASSNDTTTSEESLRFIQFYAGMKMALEAYEKRGGLPLNLEIIDEQDKNKVDQLLAKNLIQKPDCIIGPYDVESLKLVSEWAKVNRTLAISPWISSSSITSDNPYYLQIKAGLNTHFKAIGQHIQKHFSENQVYIISKTKDDARTKHFLRESGENFKEAIFSEEQLLNESGMVLEEYFSEEQPVVFVLPMTLSKDENYIYHFLRRVAAEKNGREVVIYGTYRWLDFKPEIVDYINSLNVRLCLSNMLDLEHPELRSFKLKYYEKYRELPRNDVYEGYDLMQFLLFRINKFNASKTSNLDSEEPHYFQSKYQLEAVSKDPLLNKTDYFENRFVKIVDMDGYKFRFID